MKKFFNTTGPCSPEDHYMLDPLSRLGDVKSLIDQKLYFVMHAPRQSGKTTLLEALAKTLTAEGTYAALRVSCERGQAFGSQVGKVEDAVIQALLRASQNMLPLELQCPVPQPHISEGSRIAELLSCWSQACPRPLVLFFDEIDALFDESLISVLRQLRDGFSYRPKNFPQSIVLCGLRDVRDYKVAAGGSVTLGTASPFNIKSESFRLANFTPAEVATLYTQHTVATGQEFEPEALDKAWELTEGQPWLVNALANEVVAKMKVPVTTKVTALHLEQAAQALILARATHLDSLVSKLHEDRVRQVLEPVLAGLLPEMDVTFNDDASYVRDLGLISPKAPLRIANPIYREVIVRVLAAQAADSIVFERKSFVTKEGQLDVDVIVSEFSLWWKRHAAVMLRGHVYHEAAAQLVFMAWLQRVVNGGGIIDREYGVGRGRIDVLIRWPLPGVHHSGQWQHEAFELKVWAEGEGDPLEEGLEQLERYLDGLGLNNGTLVVFDRRSAAAPSSERTKIMQSQTPKGYKVRLLRA